MLIIGGGTGMPGAVRLAGEAALRVGAGLVTVASRPEHLQVVVGAPTGTDVPLRMAGARDVAAVLIAEADVVAHWPGAGARRLGARSCWPRTFSQIAADTPLVVDADALNLHRAGIGATARRPTGY